MERCFELGTIVLLKQGQNMGPADSLALYHRMNSLPEVQEIMEALMRATTCSRRAWLSPAGCGSTAAWAIRKAALQAPWQLTAACYTETHQAGLSALPNVQQHTEHSKRCRWGAA